MHAFFNQLECALFLNFIKTCTKHRLSPLPSACSRAQTDELSLASIGGNNDKSLKLRLIPQQ